MDRIFFGKRYFNYSDEYTAELLNVTIINMENKETYMYSYKKVVPKTIMAVDLNWAAGGQISTLPIEFTYETFTYNKSIAITSSLFSNDISSQSEVLSTNLTNLKDMVPNNPNLADLSNLNREVLNNLTKLGSVSSIDFASALTGNSIKQLTEFNSLPTLNFLS